MVNGPIWTYEAVFRGYHKVTPCYHKVLRPMKDQSETLMDRETAKERFHSQALQRKVLELMDIFEPGEVLKWGAKTPQELIGYAACHLALEYERISGHPVIELLNESGACTNADLEMPAKPQPMEPLPQPTPIETSPPQPIAAAQPSEDALPL